jgi:hypothetical protein
MSVKSAAISRWFSRLPGTRSLVVPTLLALALAAPAWAESFDEVFHSVQGDAEVWRIQRPNVQQPMTDYRQIVFQDGDTVVVTAGGACQTGGSGLTWKRYVDPRSSPIPDDIVTPWAALPDSGSYYGSANIPGATPVFRRLKDIQGMTLTARPSSAAVNFLQLAYQDDGYADNGYTAFDQGIGKQAVGAGLAWVEVRITHQKLGVSGGGLKSTQTPVATAKPQNQTGTMAPRGDQILPQVMSLNVEPANLPSQGGQVISQIRAVDAGGIRAASLILIRPDGTQTGIPMERIGGTPQDGTWRAMWVVPANTTANPRVYRIKIDVADNANNVQHASQTGTITVAGRTSVNGMKPKKAPGT